MSRLLQALLLCVLVTAAATQTPTPMQCYAMGRTYGRKRNPMKEACEIAVVDCDTGSISIPAPVLSTLDSLQRAYYNGCYAALGGDDQWFDCRREFHLDGKVCDSGLSMSSHYRVRAKWKCFYAAQDQTQCVVSP